MLIAAQPEKKRGKSSIQLVGSFRMAMIRSLVDHSYTNGRGSNGWRNLKNKSFFDSFLPRFLLRNLQKCTVLVCISIHPMYTPITNPSWLNLGNWKVMRLLLYVPFLLSSLLLLLYHPAADCRSSSALFYY